MLWKKTILSLFSQSGRKKWNWIKSMNSRKTLKNRRNSQHGSINQFFWLFSKNFAKEQIELDISNISRVEVPKTISPDQLWFKSYSVLIQRCLLFESLWTELISFFDQCWNQIFSDEKITSVQHWNDIDFASIHNTFFVVFQFFVINLKTYRRGSFSFSSHIAIRSKQ